MKALINEKTIADFTRLVEETGILSPTRGLTKRGRRKIDAKPSWPAFGTRLKRVGYS